MAIPGFNPPTGNERTVCLVMVETIEGVENLDAILDVPGVDGVFVGPNDLAISHAGTNKDCADRPEEPRADRDDRPTAARKRGLAAGISCASAEEAHRFEAMGYTLLGLPSDAALLGSALVQILADSRHGGAGAVRLGVITTGLLTHGFEDGLDLVQRIGFDAIELGCAGFHSKAYCEPEQLLADPDLFSRWRDAIERRGLEISALAVHGAPLSPDPQEAATYDAEYRRACMLAERLGVSRLTLLAGLPEGGPGDRTPCWVVTPFPPYNLARDRVPVGAAGRCRTGARRRGSPRPTAAACASR